MNEPSVHHVKQKSQAQKTKEVRAQGEAERQCDTWEQHSFLPLKGWGKALANLERGKRTEALTALAGFIFFTSMHLL